MTKLIGPVLRREGNYVFDTGDAVKGLIAGEPYRRIEDAYYARNAAIVTAGLRGGDVIVCETVDELNTRLARMGKALQAA